MMMPSGPKLVKRCTIAAVSGGAWFALATLVCLSWPGRLDLSADSILLVLSASIWWAVLLWAMHHLAFQLSGLFHKQENDHRIAESTPAVAVLYATRDDFSVVSCESCLAQNYTNFRVLVLDDSRSSKYQQIVEEFCTRHDASKCERVTRPSSQGFKAGNLNYSLEHMVWEDWVLLVDADQILPPEYLSSLISRLPYQSPDIAFVQTANTELIHSGSSHFQRALSPAIRFYFLRDLRVRAEFGFVPLLGHSAMIRTSAWRLIGKFPELVSEDYAFAMRSASANQRGIFLDNPVGIEATPYDFGGFMLRIRKYASGTAQLFRREVGPFLLGSARTVEKWDVLMQLGSYWLMPLVVLNGFLSAHILHALSMKGMPYHSPILPFIYASMIFGFLCLHVATARKIWDVLRFYFWSTAIYTAAMPLAGLSFLWYLLSGKPSFNVTPKNGEQQKLSVGNSAFMTALGLAAVVAAVRWWSPFSPVLASQGIAYLSYPLYGKLCSRSVFGSLSRALIYVPGLLMLLALYTMWAWTR